MTRQEIEHMWKVASHNPNHDTNWYDPAIERFAWLVQEHEREACAKVCDDLDQTDLIAISFDSSFGGGTLACAKAIRARGEA